MALDATDQAYAYAAAHELVHALRNERGSQWADFSSFAQDALKRAGQDVDALVQEQVDRHGYNREDALEEVICNTVPAMLQDETNVMKLYQGNRTLFERVADWVNGMLEDVRAAGEALAKRGGSWKQLDALKGQRDDLQAMYDMMMDIMDGPEEVGEAQEGTAKQSQKDAEREEIGKEDVERFKTIGRKRISDFSESDMKRSIPMAESLYKELGTKSPFFQNWFGDWRRNDTSIVKIVTQRSATRGDRRNADTGWVINIGRQVFNETISHGKKKQSDATSMLEYIDGIVENAVLLDSEASGKENPYSTMYHSMYAIVDDGNAKSIVKLIVEQFDDYDGIGRLRRSYKLKNIRKEPTMSYGLQPHHNGDSFGFSISNLFEIVNENDKDFISKPSSQVVNEDGSPLVVYHGSDADFDLFDITKGRANMDIQGMFFSPYEDDAKGYGKNVRAFYLSIKNPADEATAYKALNLYKGQNGAGVKAREHLIKQGYDGVYNGYDEYIAFYPTQIKSATDNIGLFDPENENVKYSYREDDENVQSMISAMEEALPQVQAHRITTAEAERLAGKLLKEANSSYDQEQMAGELSEIIDRVERGHGVDVRQAMSDLVDLGGRVMAKSRAIDMEHEERAQPLRDYLKTSRIALSDGQWDEAANFAGNRTEYRRLLRGVRLAKDGVSLERVCLNCMTSMQHGCRRMSTPSSFCKNVTKR